MYSKELYQPGPLDGHVDEHRVNHIDFLHLAGEEFAHYIPTHRYGVAVVKLIPQIHIGMGDLHFAAPEEVPALATHTGQGDADALRLLFSHELNPGVNQIYVEAATQPAVGGHQHQGHFFHDGGALEKGVDFRIHTPGEIAQHVGKGLGIGTEALHAGLGPPQFGRGHHVHGLGDLLGLFDRGDFAPEIS